MDIPDKPVNRDEYPGQSNAMNEAEREAFEKRFVASIAHEWTLTEHMIAWTAWQAARTTAIPPALSDEQIVEIWDAQWGLSFRAERKAILFARAILAASLPREPAEKEKS